LGTFAVRRVPIWLRENSDSIVVTVGNLIQAGFGQGLNKGVASQGRAFSFGLGQLYRIIAIDASRLPGPLGSQGVGVGLNCGVRGEHDDSGSDGIPEDEGDLFHVK
jgi:hypothetical protein